MSKINSCILLKGQDMDPDWYALNVRHQNEYKVSRLLKEKVGVESLVPSQRVWRKRGGKVEIYKKPLFRAYVFTKISFRSINWRIFYSINGVMGFVRRSGAPEPIPDEQITSLEKLGSSENLVHEMEYMKLAPNDRVKVTEGPLRGAIGYFIRADNKSGQFVVSLDMFQRSLVTRLEPCLIKAY